MSLVPSLLQAIVRVDGEALVMHVGEKPYVVSPSGQIDLATRGLTFEAVNGIVAQLLSAEAMRSLEEVGATQFELPPFDEFPGEHFVITAARGGDDVWAEIRRRQAQDEELVSPELFADLVPPAVEPPAAPVADDLTLPQERQLWPERPEPGLEAPSAVAVPAPPEPVVVPPPQAPVLLAAAPVSELVPAAPTTDQAPASVVVRADEPALAAVPDRLEPIAPDPLPAVAPKPPAAVDLPIAASSPAAAAPAAPEIEVPAPTASIVVPAAEVSAAEVPAPEVPSAEVLADAAPAAVVPPSSTSSATPSSTSSVAGETLPDESQKAIASWLATFSSAHLLTRTDLSRPIEVQAEPEPSAAPSAPPVVPVLPAVPAPSALGVEPAAPVEETSPAPALVSRPAPETTAPRTVDQENVIEMSTQPPDTHPFAVTVPSPVSAPTQAADPFAAARMAPAPPVEAPQARPAAAFVSFPSLAEQPQPAVVLPMARGGREGGVEASGVSIERLLRLAASRGGTALFLSTGSRPSVRLDGDVQMLDGTTVLGAQDVESLLLGVMPERGADLARASAEWVWEIGDIGSVRCTTFRDHRGPGAVFRIVAVRPQSASQLGLSREIQALAAETEGLVLVSGPRANGKSTLVSSLVDLINRTRRDYVITLESEVNVVHDRQGAFVSQREVRGGSDEMVAAARAALREDPDVLVIEDVRTAALMTVALDAAANGQLVIGGVPAHHASGAIERLIDLHQPEFRRQVQLSLAQHLRGVVSQVLLRKSGGGRVAAREVLLNTPIVSSLLAEGRTGQLPMAIEGGRKSGMVPLNDAMVGFVQSGAVDVREVYRRAVDRAGLLDLLKRQGIDTSVVERLA